MSSPLAGMTYSPSLAIRRHAKAGENGKRQDASGRRVPPGRGSMCCLGKGASWKRQCDAVSRATRHSHREGKPRLVRGTAHAR